MRRTVCPRRRPARERARARPARGPGESERAGEPFVPWPRGRTPRSRPAALPRTSREPIRRSPATSRRTTERRRIDVGIPPDRSSVHMRHRNCRSRPRCRRRTCAGVARSAGPVPTGSSGPSRGSSSHVTPPSCEIAIRTPVRTSRAGSLRRSSGGDGAVRRARPKERLRRGGPVVVQLRRAEGRRVVAERAEDVRAIRRRAGRDGAHATWTTPFPSTASDGRDSTRRPSRPTGFAGWRSHARSPRTSPRRRSTA